MAYATVTDVSTRLGRPITSEDEVAQVGAWLEDAETLILARIPDLAMLVSEGAPPASVVAMIEANAVVRKVRNPEGYTSETIDDYTYRRGEDSRRGELFLTDDEWALLRPPGSSVAFSTRPGFESDADAAESWA